MHEKFFEMSIDLLSIANLKGFYLKVNPAFTTVLGYTYEELTTKKYYNFLHPEDIAKTKEIESVLEKELVIKNFENRYRHKNGSYRTLSWNCSLDQKKKEVYAVARDVTEQRHAESNLAQIYKSLDDHSIVAFTDKDGLITKVNDNFCKISKYNRDELIGQNHRVLNSGLHDKKFWQHMWRTISSGATWSGLIHNKAKDGTLYHVYSIFSPFFDSQGAIDGYIAIRYDVSETIKFKEDYEHTIQILNETSSIAKVGGWELDVATGFLNWTDETFNILEVEKKKDRKPQLPEGLELFTPQAKPIIEQAIQRGIELGEPYALELQAQTAKGNILWVYTNGKAHYENGKVIKLSGTIQDINARKLAQIKFEAERKKSIQNSKLASLGEISAGIAHEINNPLAIIIGNISLLTRHIDQPDKLKDRITKISKSCDRIHQIVKNLKRYSTSSENIQREPVKVKDIITEAVSLAELKAKKFNTKLVIKSETNSKILCNEIEIEQVLINLINNSIDATKNLQEHWVEITTNETDKEIIIELTDSGTGIPAHIREKLFEPFYTTKPMGEGTGLGLSITRGILDEHQALIEIDSDSPHTCFILKFKKYEE